MKKWLGFIGAMTLVIVGVLLFLVFGNYRLWRSLDHWGVQSFLGLNVHGMRGATQVGALIAVAGFFLIWLAGPLFRSRGDSN